MCAQFRAYISYLTAEHRPLHHGVSLVVLPSILIPPLLRVWVHLLARTRTVFLLFPGRFRHVRSCSEAFGMPCHDELHYTLKVIPITVATQPLWLGKPHPHPRR